MGLKVYSVVELNFNKRTNFEQTDTPLFSAERGWRIERDGDTVTFAHVGTKDAAGKPAIRPSGESFEVPWGQVLWAEVAK